MRILGSIVAPSTTLMSSCDSKITGSGSIRPQIVRDQLVWDKSMLLQQLAHEVQRGTLVPLALEPQQSSREFASTTRRRERRMQGFKCPGSAQIENQQFVRIQR